MLSLNFEKMAVELYAALSSISVKLEYEIYFYFPMDPSQERKLASKGIEIILMQQPILEVTRIDSK